MTFYVLVKPQSTCKAGSFYKPFPTFLGAEIIFVIFKQNT